MIGILPAIAPMEAEVVNQLPIPTFMYGAIALAILLFLLVITFAFKSVGLRHEAHEEHFDPNRQHANNHGLHSDSSH
ncbi:hypothetical protein [Haematomicrobium sanguinis]|uniref:hypothetical protein n=1 Tax=Haematomicrobium sanguinis TaxID=479106 RepID=UPI0005555FFC|nr:hypothetical protein [Haematomicrobium sanguinis]